jgi:uncharacterized protein YaiL (DUF2058 family)
MQSAATEQQLRRAEILAAVDRAKASLAAGRSRIITEESMRQLADEVKARGRVRLAKDKLASVRSAH